MKQPTTFAAALLWAAVLLPSAACTQETPPTTSGAYQFAPVLPHLSFAQPVAFASPKGTPIWFVNEQGGRILRFDASTKGAATVALDIRDRVRSGGERGLLGIALDPKFETNHRVFVNYTTEKPGTLTTRISSFTSKDGGKTFSPDSEDVVLTYEQPYSNHNGGHITFGPDGMLYIGVGDGGSGGDPKGNGQNVETLLGAILRIDVSGPKGYVSPPDNPLVGKPGRDEIYAWGLRNPWKFNFGPDGRLWVADVGQNKYEEVDIVEAGKNYGWNTMEASHCFEPASGCQKAGLELPVIEYGRSEGQSITGGYVYRGNAMPELKGKYIFGDFVTGRVWAFDPKTKQRTLLVETSFTIPTFVEDYHGELFIADYGSGTLQQLKHTPATSGEH